MSDTKKCTSTLDMEKVSAVLLDVAGTTTAISFVKETLYPYIIKNVEEFLKSNFESEDVKKALEKFEEKDLDPTKAAEAVKNLTEKDDSNEGLKTIQGLLLKQGYENGELKGHVFSDVPKFFDSWSATKKIAIFSSGSIESQQLLFKNSTEGDLSVHIKKFFDLSFGSKADSETYKKIAKELEVEPVDLVFLTDDLKEAEAAKSADVNVVIVEREGNASIPEESHANFTIVKSFAEVQGEKMKRKIIEDEAAVEAPPSKMAKIEVADEVVEKVENEVKPEENKDIETAVEAMEVDQDTITETKATEVPSKDAKSELKNATDEKKVEAEKIESEKVEENSEAMEVDSKADKSSADKISQTTEVSKNKTETETQTKCAVTNECETQTTISLAAVEELPNKKVEDILKSNEKDATADQKVEQTLEKNEEKKSEEPLEKENTDNENPTTEEANVQKEKNDNEEAKEKDVQDKKEDTEINADATVEGLKGEVKEGIKEVKEGIEKVDENVKSEGSDEVKDKNSASTKENGQGEENSNSCEEGNATNEVESSNDKKEESSNGSHEVPETKLNGTEDEKTVKEKENESQLANGKEKEVSNGESANITTNGIDQKEEEIKVKKITDNVESAPVSVEA